MTPTQRTAALSHLAHAQATAAELHSILTRVSDVREPEDGGAAWKSYVERARELLGKAIAEVTRYAVT